MGIAKLIKSSVGQKNTEEGRWHRHDEIKPFILGIEAGNIEPTQVSSTLISGVPSPWARAKLFWFAFDYLQREDANIKTSGLIDFYKTLVEEWKGLIALIALFPDRITFSPPIYMNPEDENLFNLTAALGRMLMEEADFWTDQEKKLTNPKELPFIQLIRYDGQLVGATSPFSIFFPAVEYKLENTRDIKWYIDGKLKDPTNYLKEDKDKLQKLYLFLKNIDKNFDEYENNFKTSGKTLNLSGLKKHIRAWYANIKDQNKNLQERGIIPKYTNVANPYGLLLHCENKVYYLKEGKFKFNKPEDTTEFVELSELQNILKEDKKIIGWYDLPDKRKTLDEAPVYLLKVHNPFDNENQYVYFPLPLTIEGLQLFNQDIGKLVSKDPMLVGRINDKGNLTVDLTVTIDNQPYKLPSKEYEIEWQTMNKKVIVWPDFISTKWDAYYIYSEYPSNLQGIKFIPFFKQAHTGKIITLENRRSGKQEVVYFNNPEEDLREAGIEITHLIQYPAGQVLQEMPMYEVIKSNRPIAGLEIRIEYAGRTTIAGYLIVKSPGEETMGNKKIVDYSTEYLKQEAIVGIDFGSNNSCVHYILTTGASNNAQPINFTNRRLVLVGAESSGEVIAEKDELLFFSNEPANNGQVKSWLHEHDARYVGYHVDKEIAGGVLVNEKNILVKEMDREKIITQAGVLNYNMKWLSDEQNGVAKKTAYLKALWLYICADLYAQKCKPVEIRWAFPGSMSAYDLNQYRAIYNTQLPSITPIYDNNNNRIILQRINEQTEAEAVCKYALSREFGLDNNIFLGIDIGGSTSDILLLAKDPNSGNKPRLYAQSSVRIAAGVFFDAIIKSQKFRQAIYNYHQSQRRIKIENIDKILREPNTAPFYLNSIFDQLNLNSIFDQLNIDEFHVFYSFIHREAPFVFAIPAYVTGLLVFYAGKLCARTIKENNLTFVREIHLMPFGKGGRLFHWLQTIPGSSLTNRYYEDCFRKAFGVGAENIRLIYRQDISVDNKSEVSKGLVVDNELIYDENIRFNSDICGEKNIKYIQNGEEINFNEDSVISNEYFEQINQFEFPDKLENFEDFLQIFIDFAGNKAGLVREITILRERARELRSRLSAYIQNDAEYRKAKTSKRITNRFEYRPPIFIVECLCYLEQILIPELFNN